MLDMIRWMRTHNQNPGATPVVSFAGFDMQAPSLPLNSVIAYLQKVDAQSVEHARSLYACFQPYVNDPHGYASLPQTTKAQCHQNVQTIYDQISAHQSTYEAASSPQEFARALHSARIVVQAEDEFSCQDVIQSSSARDRYMAENVTWLLEQAGPTAKIVLWAHNEHVSTTPNGQIKRMGQYLRGQYGDAMRVFGFDFYAGSFNAYSLSGESIGPLGVHQASPPPGDSYEYFFDQANMPRMFVDLRGARTGLPATHWLLDRHPVRSIGAAYDDTKGNEFYDEVSLPDKFDVVIYFQDTTPSTLLR
jgi:erythromycin esterase